MKMNKLSAGILMMGLALMVACKGKPKDADIQAKVNEALKSSPGVMAEVKEGVVTLSGQVPDDAAKAAAETMAKTTEGVKEVTNNITVAPPAPVPAQPAVAVAADDALTTGVATAVKDFPGVSATVSDGVVTVNGEIAAAKWKKLKMALDALKPKKVDASGLKVK